jgi:hypothetical protein
MMSSRCSVKRARICDRTASAESVVARGEPPLTSRPHPGFHGARVTTRVLQELSHVVVILRRLLQLPEYGGSVSRFRGGGVRRCAHTAAHFSHSGGGSGPKAVLPALTRTARLRARAGLLGRLQLTLCCPEARCGCARAAFRHSCLGMQ